MLANLHHWEFHRDADGDNPEHRSNSASRCAKQSCRKIHLAVIHLLTHGESTSGDCCPCEKNFERQRIYPRVLQVLASAHTREDREWMFESD